MPEHYRNVKAVGGGRLHVFYSGRFSNWANTRFDLDSFSYRTAEHRMMHAKALLFGDRETAARILAAKTPREAKALGRLVGGFVEAVWVENRERIMVEALLGKFGAHADLREALLAGKGRYVEASPTDRIWGVGLGEDDPRIANPEQWRGLNLLGQALDKARDRLA